jgi:hypothetical protein
MHPYASNKLRLSTARRKYKLIRSALGRRHSDNSSVQDDHSEGSVDSSCSGKNNSEDHKTTRERLDSYLATTVSMKPLCLVRTFHVHLVVTNAVCGSTHILWRRHSSHRNKLLDHFEQDALAHIFVVLYQGGSNCRVCVFHIRSMKTEPCSDLRVLSKPKNTLSL